MKDREGHVIGFEKLNFINDHSDTDRIYFETIIMNKNRLNFY